MFGKVNMIPRKISGAILANLGEYRDIVKEAQLKKSPCIWLFRIYRYPHKLHTVCVFFSLAYAGVHYTIAYAHKPECKCAHEKKESKVDSQMR